MGQAGDQIAIGDSVRSFDFEGRDDTYVEGVVTDIVEIQGLMRYEIKVSRRVIEGREDQDPAWRSDPVYPPVNGLAVIGGAGRVTAFVRKI